MEQLDPGLDPENRTPAIQDEAEVLRWFAQAKSYQWMCEEYERRYNMAAVPAMFGALRRRAWPGGLDRPRPDREP